MDVLITGGNGFVGRHLANELLARGDAVRILALPDEDASSLDARIVVHRGDIRICDTLPEAVEGADAVVHLAAMMHVWRPLSEYAEVNLQGTVNVCRAAMAAGVGRLVHMSSSTVYGMEAPGPIDESYPFRPFDDPYSLTKAQADLEVQRLVRESGLPAVIIRPDQIFGAGDRLHFGETASRLARGRGVIVGKGDNFIPLVHVDDVVQGLLLALDSPNAVGEAFNITSDSPITQRDFLDLVAAATGGRRARIRVPLRGLSAAATVAEGLFAAVGGSRRPPVTRLGAAFAGTSVRFSIDKARRDLGYSPKVSLRDGIERTAAWYLEQRTGDTHPAEDPAGSRHHEFQQHEAPLVNRVAVITGAGSGIGAAVAREMARRGAKVVLAGRRTELLRAEEDAIRAAGGEAISIQTDVTDPEQITHLIKETEAQFGRVDILVNNAGAFWRKPFAGTAADDLIQLMQVNLTGAMLATRAALPGMLERRSGSIIMIGSVSGRVAMEPIYSAGKYGLRGFSLALRRQVKDKGVDVCCVHPGQIRTDMTKDVEGPLPGPEMVASMVCDLVERPRRETVVPRRHYAIVWLEQTIPALADVAFRIRHWSPVR